MAFWQYCLVAALQISVFAPMILATRSNALELAVRKQNTKKDANNCTTTNCEKCDTNNNCQKCRSGYYYHSSRSSCMAECPNGYFASQSDSLCKVCDSQCSLCRNSATYCISCRDNLVASSGSCLASCPIGQSPRPVIRECVDDGSIMEIYFQVFYEYDFNSLSASEGENIINTFRSSLGVDDSLIGPIYFKANSSITSTIAFSLIGSFSQTFKAEQLIEKRLQLGLLAVPVNNEKIMPSEFTRMDDITLVKAKTPFSTDVSTGVSTSPVTTVSNSSAGPFWNRNLFGLLVWNWIAIIGGALLLLVLALCTTSCICLCREGRKKREITAVAKRRKTYDGYSYPPLYEIRMGSCVKLKDHTNQANQAGSTYDCPRYIDYTLQAQSQRPVSTIEVSMPFAVEGERI